jgi:hypothetical protein
MSFDKPFVSFSQNRQGLIGIQWGFPIRPHEIAGYEGDAYGCC